MQKHISSILACVLGLILILNFMTVWSSYDKIQKNLKHAQMYQYEKHAYFWEGMVKTFPEQSLMHEIIWQIRN